MIHCAQSPTSLKKMRDEFVALASKRSGAEKGDKTRREVVDEVVDFEFVNELEYLSWVL